MQPPTAPRPLSKAGEVVPTSTSSKRADRLWSLGLLSLIGSTVPGFATLDWDGVWVIGSWVPRRIDAVGAPSGAGLLLRLLAVHRKRVMARHGSPPREKHRARVSGARFMTVAVLLGAPLTAFVAFLDGWDAFHVLQPASTGGCRVVVQESDSFDTTISTTVYLVPADEHRARRSVSTSAVVIGSSTTAATR